MERKPLFVFMVFLVLAAPVFSATLLEELVGSDHAAILRSAAGSGDRGELLSEAQLRNPSLRLLPRHGELGRLVTETKRNLEPSMLVETLFLYAKPHGRVAEWSEAERVGLFNSVTALSTLTGIQYFSASRGGMRTFYESSQVINNPQNRTPLPDPSFAALPETLALYARQRDLTFGDNTYRFEYRTGADFIFFTQENLTSMSVGILPVIGRNRFQMVMAIIDAGDSLLIYAAAMSLATSPRGMGDRIGNSFNNRLQAVLQWFSEHADRVFRESTTPQQAARY